MICGSQWLMLLSSEINSNMNNDVINKGDTIGQNSSKYSCTKAQNKSDICKVDIYSEIDEITTAVNLKLLAINEARKVLEEEYYKVKNTEYNTFHLSGLFEDNNKQDNLVNKIILQYKETKENAKAEIKRNNEFIKELKNKISLCNKNKN